MKNILRRILVFLGLLIVFTVLWIGAELLGDDAKRTVKEFTGEEYFLPVVIGVVVVALLISVFWSEGDKIFNRSKKALIKGGVEDNLFQEAREGQRKAFVDRSNRKLAGRDFIGLEVSYTVEGSHDLASLLNKGVEEGEKEQDLLKVFEGASGRILMIGLPGAGKTTLLLQLAIVLLDKYEEHIPVVLDIATWQPRFKSIEEWAVELLPDMGFNKSLAKQLVAEKKLLPLFDGLDELGEESRPAFLEAVEKYGVESANKFVITSRKAEYAGTIDAAVEYQVVVNPFTLAQIRKTLQDMYSPERTAILEVIDKDEYSRDAIKTPFYLNAMQLLFSLKRSSQKLAFQADDLEGRKREIESALVEYALGGLENYSKEDGGKWLAFLADRMERRGKVKFELADMLYDWGHFGKWDMFKGRFLHGMVDAFAFAVTLYLLVLPFIAVYVGWKLNLSITLLNVTVLVLMMFLQVGFVALIKGLRASVVGDPIEIQVKDKAKWTIRGFFAHAREDGRMIVLLGLTAGSTIGILTYLNFGIKYSLIYGFLTCLVFSLALFILMGMVKMVGLSYQSYLKIDSPYQRFWGSTKILHFSILQHQHLCNLLRKKGLIPRRYPDFLQAVTLQNIMESDGGSWRFRHRILQKYFVRVWEEKYGGDEALKDNWHPEE